MCGHCPYLTEKNSNSGCDSKKPKANQLVIYIWCVKPGSQLYVSSALSWGRRHWVICVPWELAFHKGGGCQGQASSRGEQETLELTLACDLRVLERLSVSEQMVGMSSGYPRGYAFSQEAMDRSPFLARTQKQALRLEDSTDIQKTVHLEQCDAGDCGLLSNSFPTVLFIPCHLQASWCQEW